MRRATDATVSCKLRPFAYNFNCSGLQTDNESRTAFQYVASVGEKNVYRIFAGGDHSWVVIDDIIPVRNSYRVPSPVPNYTTGQQS